MFRLLIPTSVITLVSAAFVSAEPVNDWTGWYAGAEISATNASTLITGNRFTYNQNRALNIVSHKYNGLGFGPYIGWNAQRGRVVYGIEASFKVQNLNSNLTFNTDNDIDSVKMRWSAGLVARLGYAFGNSLIYGKAGLAAAKINNIGGDVNGGNLTLSDAHIRDDIFIGPTAGIGYELLFKKQWIARLEYAYSDYGSYSQANQDGAPGSQVYQVNNGPYQTVSFGLARKF